MVRLTRFSPQLLVFVVLCVEALGRVRHSQAPDMLQAVQEGPTTFTFSWVPVSSTAVTGYTLTCDPSLEGIPTFTHTTQQNQTTVTTYNLENGVTYSCSVVATSSGRSSSPPSNKIQVTTNESAPSGPPTNFTLKADWFYVDCLSFSWGPPLPADRNGEIISYKIFCTHTKNAQPVTANYTAEARSGTICHLNQDTEYTCSIIAKNNAGGSPSMSMIAVTSDQSTLIVFWTGIAFVLLLIFNILLYILFFPCIGTRASQSNNHFVEMCLLLCIFSVFGVPILLIYLLTYSCKLVLRCMSLNGNYQQRDVPKTTLSTNLIQATDQYVQSELYSPSSHSSHEHKLQDTFSLNVVIDSEEPSLSPPCQSESHSLDTPSLNSTGPTTLTDSDSCCNSIYEDSAALVNILEGVTTPGSRYYTAPGSPYVGLPSSTTSLLSEVAHKLKILHPKKTIIDEKAYVLSQYLKHPDNCSLQCVCHEVKRLAESVMRQSQCTNEGMNQDPEFTCDDTQHCPLVECDFTCTLNLAADQQPDTTDSVQDDMFPIDANVIIIPAGDHSNDPPDPPIKPLIDPPKFEDLMEEVAALIPEKWADVATKLGLKTYEIKHIELLPNRTPNDYYREVFSVWERNEPKPYCWQTIITALKTNLVNESGLASSIENQIN